MRRFHFLIAVGLLFFASVRADSSYNFPASDESLHWFPALATPQSNGWTITLHGLITEEEKRPAVSWLSRKLLGFSAEELGPSERKSFEERTRRFFSDDQRGKKIEIRIGGHSFDLGKTARNGHFTKNIFLPNELFQQKIKDGLPCVLFSDRRSISNEIPLCVVQPDGFSVISDIDDTIKISHVLDRDELLRNTFLRPLRAVDGMSANYRRWAANSGAQFHYVSGSPWQLFPALQDFVATNQFPAGSWHLRTARLTGFSARELLKAPDHHKESEIKELFARLEKQHFILIGDSGEHDPEIYGKLAQKYPERVAHIYIRDVTGDLASSGRYQKAFRGLPKTLWTIFKTAEELPDKPIADNQ